MKWGAGLREDKVESCTEQHFQEIPEHHKATGMQ